MDKLSQDYGQNLPQFSTRIPLLWELRTYPMPEINIAVRQLRPGLHSGLLPRFAVTGVGSPTVHRCPFLGDLLECSPYDKGLRPLSSHILQWVQATTSCYIARSLMRFAHRLNILNSGIRMGIEPINFQTQEKGFGNGFVDFGPQNTNLLLVSFPAYGNSSHRTVYPSGHFYAATGTAKLDDLDVTNRYNFSY